MAPSSITKHNKIAETLDRETLLQLLQAPQGENYFTAHAGALRSALRVDAVVIAEWKKNEDLLLVHGSAPGGLHPEGGSFPVQDSPFQSILEKRTPAYESDLQVCFPRFSSQYRQDFSHFIGYPLEGSIGEAIGVIGILQRHPFLQPESILGAFRLIAPGMVRELERLQAEDFLLESAQSVDALMTSLREIHRLTSTPFESLDHLFTEYIRTGSELFHMPHGILISKEEGLVRVVSGSNGSVNILSATAEIGNSIPGKIFSGYEIDEFTSWRSGEEGNETAIRQMIASPVYLAEKTRGTLIFFSDDSSIPVEEHFREVLELMAQSIGNEFHRRHAVETIQAIQRQQDGDYYLTSLLVKPLARYNVQSENISIEFILKQKKEFQFRDRQREIGGDICIAHTVRLRERNYVVFVNADAMGKSIQGAGGTLVLGAVFESIMERTRSSDSYSRLSPEEWLVAAVRELNGVFLSFDYSMLVSLIIALVDDDTGVFFFINAEHPSPVLWRDESASFLHNEPVYAKIGAIETDTRIAVSAVKLRPGDILYVGSDGKDDIMTNREGKLRRSTDPELFLKHVCSSKGDLQQIVQRILQTGELTDDLSILKLEVRRVLSDRAHPAAFETAQLFLKYKQARRSGDILEASVFLHEAFLYNRRNPRILKELALFYLHQGSLSKAVHAFDSFLRYSEESLQSLIEGSFFYRRAGEWKTAVDCAERVRLRSPLNLRNLIHLLLMNVKRGNDEKAEELRQELERIKPTSYLIRRINRILVRYDI